jgi:hypothetical protein
MTQYRTPVPPQHINEEALSRAKLNIALPEGRAN